MDVKGYLERIGAIQPGKPDFAGLEHLQRQHLFTVPFENLDILRKVPIQLDENRIYDKVVRRHRGGFCYELNGLFHRLLDQLGYRTRLVAGTVKKEEGGWALADSHATVLVELDGWWLVDVGFGDSARLPLPLTGEERTDVSGTYRVVPVSGREGVFDLQRKQGGSWATRLRFSTTPKELREFAPQCRFNQTSPDSPFTGKSIVTLPTEEGRITLSGNTLVVTKGETKQKEEIPSSSLPEVLREQFGMVLQ